MIAREYLSVVFDGPAGVGKSTIAKCLAQKLNFQYVDTGAMYRTATLLALENQLSLDSTNEEQIVKLVSANLFKFINKNDGGFSIFHGERDITDAIRAEAVSAGVSLVAAMPDVRNCLTKLQRELAAKTNIVMEGRDIGTVVLPNATHKFFLTASPEKRAERRYDEIKATTEVSLEAVRNNILTRDHLDSTRSHAPLSIPEDAVVIDTTELTISEVLQAILQIIGIN